MAMLDYFKPFEFLSTLCQRHDDMFFMSLGVITTQTGILWYSTGICGRKKSYKRTTKHLWDRMISLLKKQKTKQYSCFHVYLKSYRGCRGQHITHQSSPEGKLEAVVGLSVGKGKNACQHCDGTSLWLLRIMLENFWEEKEWPHSITMAKAGYPIRYTTLLCPKTGVIFQSCCCHTDRGVIRGLEP